MKSFLFVMAAAMLLISCNSGRGDDLPKKVTDYIEGRVLHCNDIVGNGFVSVLGDTVIMKYYRARHICAMFTVSGDTLSKVSDFLYRGRGPKELLNPILREENGCVYALDRTGYGAGRMLKIPIDSTDFVDDLSCWEEEDLTWSNPMNMGGGDFLFLSDGNMLLTGDDWGVENLLSVLDLTKKRKYPVGYWIEDGYDGAVLPKQSLYGKMSLFRNGEKVLYVCGEGRYMELLGMEKGKIISRTSIYAQPPEYIDKDGLNFGLTSDSERGIRVCTTERYIYAVLCGRWNYPEKYKGYPCGYRDEIEVYDWDGDFIRKFQTSVPFDAMSVSEDDKVLYTLSVDLDSMEPVVIRYDLDNTDNVRHF